MCKKIFILTLFLLLFVSSRQVCWQESFYDAKVSEYGQLDEALGEKWDGIDSLIVHGPMDSLDFKVIVRCAKEGRVRVVNLQYAQVKGHRIPDEAFFDWDMYENNKKYMPIRRVILPDDIMEIGAFSFLGLALQQINMPASLKKLSDSSFEDTWIESIVIPEGVAEIPVNCFNWCRRLKKVVLPSTLKTIADLAFYAAGVDEMTLPDGLDSIGTASLYATSFSEIIVPNSVRKIGNAAFHGNVNMKRIVFPAGMTSIPSRVCSGCPNLEEAQIPKTVKEIGLYAFSGCHNLKNILLPPNLERVGAEAFEGCQLDSLVFPATVKYLGGSAFVSESIQKIYSLSPEPPVCGHVSSNPERHTFYGSIRQDIPVYVPYGSAKKYRNAFGWSYFTNYIETDRFPTGIVSARTDNAGRYKVYGRDSRLVIEDSGVHSVSVLYSIHRIDGRLIGRGSLIKTYTSEVLPHDVYIVRVGDVVRKIKL